MTAITIDKELLEQVVNKLLTCWPKSDPLVNELRAALAAPATAPAQPEIVDLLAEMYELILANKVVLAEKSGGVWTWPDRAIEAVRKHRPGPAQPAWHDAPTVPGLWLNSVFMKVEDVEQWHIDCQLHLECARWFGPIPPDGDKP